MSAITLFRQARADGGVRTGIGIEGDTVLEHYQAETDEHDPALLWYLDIRCRGERLPVGPEDARRWLMDHAAYFASRLRSVAQEHLDVGFDAELRPFIQRLDDAPDDAEVEIVASAVRRLEAREIAGQLTQLADEFEPTVRQLSRLSAV